MKHMKWNIVVALSACLLVMNLSAQTTWELVWSDEFSNPIIDATKWQHEFGGFGWGNNELQYYGNSDDNSFIENGVLTIRAEEENFGTNEYTSARLITKDLFSVQYGKIEARIKFPMGAGLWPAFWMLGQNIDELSWPACGEIDIMEHVNEEEIAYGNVHWSSNGQLVSNGGQISVDPDVFHIYGIVWDEASIRMYVDGVTYYERNILNNAGNTQAFHEPFFMILNLAVGGNWPGSPNAQTVFPADYLIDYVRVFQPAQVGVEEAKTSELVVAPNPFTDAFQLINAQGFAWSMYDVLGRKVADASAGRSPIIQTENWAEGLYVIQYLDQYGQQHSIKAVKSASAE
jgi:beta-glucanase (GH16 family)